MHKLNVIDEEIANIEKQANDLKCKAEELRREKIRLEEEDNKQYIGKCFRESGEEYPLYLKIVGIEFPNVLVLALEPYQSELREASIYTTTDFYLSAIRNGRCFREISEEEFKFQFDSINNLLTAFAADEK